MINTSFNVRGEPIVCRPQEAYQCFLATNIDGAGAGAVRAPEKRTGARRQSIAMRKDPSARELAWFGVLLLAFSLLVGTLVWWSLGAGRYVWLGGAVAAAVYYAMPPPAAHLQGLDVRRLSGWLISHVLAAICFVLFTSVAVVMRLVGYDPLSRRFDRAARSYWLRRERPLLI
jgi:hypothetical protein